MAAARAGAKSKGLELFEYIGQMHSPSDNSFLLPNPMFNVLNGGSHAFNSTDFQEFMVVPLGVENYEESLLCGFQIYNELKKILEKEKLPTTLGDEGGFAPPGLTNTEPLELLAEATKKTSFELGKHVKFALDVAASEFYSEEGSGDYTVVFDFTNDFGSATSSFDGRTYWAWFHICETKSNGKCDGGA